MHKAQKQLEKLRVLQRQRHANRNLRNRVIVQDYHTLMPVSMQRVCHNKSVPAAVRLLASGWRCRPRADDEHR
eukprot:4721088-Amphidinium_carterae.1